MGSLKQDDHPATENESTPIFIESDLSENGMLNGKSEVQNGELANGLLRDKPEVQDVEPENELLKAKPKVQDVKRLNKQLKNRLGKIRSKMPTVMKDEKLEDRLKFLRFTINRVKNGDEFFQIDDFGTRPALLEELFADPNLTEETERVPKEFKIHVDCQQFKPNEIKVVVKGGSLLVHCSHDTKPDDHGFIKREFKRSWAIPEDVKHEEFSCLLDRYGILTLRAPRKESTDILVQTQESEYLEM